jgi:hypothetical protein
MLGVSPTGRRFVVPNALISPNEDARRKQILELNEQLKVCTDAGDWQTATTIMAKLRSKELRETSLKIKKDRLNPTTNDIEGMFKVEGQLIRSLAKVRADMQLLQRGKGAAVHGHLEVPMAKWETLNENMLLLFLQQVSGQQEGLLESLLREPPSVEFDSKRSGASSSALRAAREAMRSTAAGAS